MDILPKGRSLYRDSHPTLHESQPRIYVKFRPAGVPIVFWALLDTGAHFCLLNEEVAGLVQSRLTQGLGLFRVKTAHGLVQGQLYRHPITLPADVGESLDIDATIFVPPGWQGPCILGYAGVLDRVVFMVNPWGNLFCFGTP